VAGEKRGSLVDKIATIFAGFFFVLTLLRSHYGMNRPSVVCLSSVTLLHPTQKVTFRQYFCNSQ